MLRKYVVCQLILVLLITSGSVLGHETDQYTTPVGREFADLGPYFNRWVYRAIERGCDKVNRQIKLHIQQTGSEKGIEKYHDPKYVSQAVFSSFPWAMDVIEGLEVRIASKQAWQDYPGRVVGYKHMFNNALANIHFPIDPRQVFRIWLGSTMKVYGHYVGTDKFGHFTDMGNNYYLAYIDAIKKGKSEEEAMNAAIKVGTTGFLFSETGILGYLSAGAYSNGDMVANYMGLLFYKNLLSEVELNGRKHAPMFVRDGIYLKIASHIQPNNDFFAAFISDHWDEALNPSHYEQGMRNAVRQAVRERSTGILERYHDINGCRRSGQWFYDKTQSLKTYYGQSYGHKGTMDDRITITKACYPKMPGNSKPNDRNHLGFTLLHQYAATGDVVHLKRLVNAGWDVNVTVCSDELVSSDWGNTPLHLACRNGHVEAAKWLLEKGAKVNFANDRGVTPLHLASGHPKLVAMLLARGARTNAKDVYDRSPLYWAVGYQSKLAVVMLIKKGTDVDVVDYAGRTALHQAALLGHDEILQTLLDHQANPKITDRFGRTPLHLAAAKGHVDATMALAPYDAKAVDHLGKRPIHLAAGAGHLEAFKVLCEYGNVPDRFGNTMLHLALRHGHEDIVQLLCQKQNDWNKKNNAGNTPLHEAAFNGCTSCIESLLNVGANKKMVNNNGQSPAAIAKQTGHGQAMKMLIEYNQGVTVHK